MNGHYGEFGGQYVAETLMPTLIQLEKEYECAKKDPTFQEELDDLLKNYIGRESPLFEAKRLSQYCGGARIFIKREDIIHTGAHKINNTIGQALLAKRMGRTRLTAETGAGMHGVATATVAAHFGMSCEIFMGAVDIERQRPNVDRMLTLGATVHSVTAGSATLKSAMNEAIRDWTARVDDTFYVLGTVAGPHPYPKIVRDFQSIIGREARRQCIERTGKLPREVIACVGGGSNAMGIFAGFLDEQNEQKILLTGVEAGGRSLNGNEHAASIGRGRIGVLHGAKCMLLQDNDGQILDAYSVSAGLDYPGVGPEHCLFAQNGTARYVSINDEEAIQAFDLLARLEGIIPALESSHAIAYTLKSAPNYQPDDIVLVNLSGRGDKDMQNVQTWKKEHSVK